MIGVLGVGESMGKFLRFSVMRMGKVIQAIHELEPGDKLTVRGPYGNSFPVDEWKGKNIITIGGGIGQAPLRPIMIKFVLENLKKLNFADEQIYTTLENRVKCGFGKCGRCNVGGLYVCKDGPVFSYAALKDIPEAFA